MLKNTLIHWTARFIHDPLLFGGNSSQRHLWSGGATTHCEQTENAAHDTFELQAC